MYGNKDIYFARVFFAQKQYDKAKEIFLNNDMLYEAGFCALLSGNVKGAKLIWKEMKDPCIACTWGLCVIDVIENKPFIRSPGYFQTRAFLEVYINLFLENKLYDFVDALVNSYKFFTRANPETPKFIARILYVWGYYPMVHEFAALSKDLCYEDPEIHFIECETYLAETNLKMAYDCIEETLKVAPNYFPAIKMKKHILEDIGYNPEE